MRKGALSEISRFWKRPPRTLYAAGLDRRINPRVQLYSRGSSFNHKGHEGTLKETSFKKGGTRHISLRSLRLRLRAGTLQEGLTAKIAENAKKRKERKERLRSVRKLRNGISHTPFGKVLGPRRWDHKVRGIAHENPANRRTPSLVEVLARGVSVDF